MDKKLTYPLPLPVRSLSSKFISGIKNAHAFLAFLASLRAAFARFRAITTGPTHNLSSPLCLLTSRSA